MDNIEADKVNRNFELAAEWRLQFVWKTYSLPDKSHRWNEQKAKYAFAWRLSSYSSKRVQRGRDLSLQETDLSKIAKPKWSKAIIFQISGEFAHRRSSQIHRLEKNRPPIVLDLPLQDQELPTSNLLNLQDGEERWEKPARPLLLHLLSATRLKGNGVTRRKGNQPLYWCQQVYGLHQQDGRFRKQHLKLHTPPYRVLETHHGQWSGNQKVVGFGHINNAQQVTATLIVRKHLLSESQQHTLINHLRQISTWGDKRGELQREVLIESRSHLQKHKVVKENWWEE